MEWRTPLSSRRTSTHQPLSNMYCTLFILNPELTDARDDVVYPTLSPFWRLPRRPSATRYVFFTVPLLYYPPVNFSKVSLLYFSCK